MTKRILSTLIIILICNGNIEAKMSEIKKENQAIINYINDAWQSLTRTVSNCSSLVDPKTHLNTILYLPKNLPVPPSIKNLMKNCSISVRYLPKRITHLGQINAKTIGPSGLLYLPNDYVVPGGMFNEMYGWDSYFIIRGLIESGKIDLALGMVENFFFEIDHYGAILNANRTYYLTRSQPPFLTSMIKTIYLAKEKQKHIDNIEDNQRENLAWLAKAYNYAVKDYELWTTPPHLDRNSKLSRYYDFNGGPVPELDDSSKTYYKDILSYFSTQPEKYKNYLTKTLEQKLGLSQHFYKGDRAMRESGFDTSFRFGPFSADTTYYAPIELNCLLYKAEKDLAWMSTRLKQTAQASLWLERANARKALIQQAMWNDQEGLYFDYDIKNKKQSQYRYATTFFTLWTGIATDKQAKRLVENLQIFEKPGGIVASPYQTGAQWDAPYTWAPLQLIAVEGLARYGFREDARRLSKNYIDMITKNFHKEKTIREKYDALTTSSVTNVQVGYKINATGFGWTNGVFLVLWNHYI